MTDQTAPLPEPNWYPDPEVPGHLRWWDGLEWRARVPVAVEEPPELAAGFQARSTVLVVLLATSLVTSVLTSGLFLWGSTSVADELEAGDYSSASTYDALNLALFVVDMLVLVATIVCWCVWQYKLAKGVPAGRLARSPGMHVGSWFIPVVALWFPLQNMRSLWDAYRPAQGRAVLGWWWACWLVVTFLNRIAYSETPGDDIDGFRDYNTLELTASVTWVVLSGLAIYVVVTLSRAALAGAED